MTVVIVIVIFALAFMFAAKSLGRSTEKMRGHAKCTFCGKRLKKVGASYAKFCKACGREQPWSNTYSG